MRQYKTYQKVLVCVLPFAAAALLWGACLFVKNHITLPECTFHRLTGLYCPGCGNTRALFALLEGNILLSLRENVTVAVLATTAVLLYPELIFRAFGKRLRSPVRNNYYLFAVLILLLIYYLLRNFIPAIAPI
ncbi:MAG: DUF2752 domain-containing protein [Clostridiales bacterium]|nr:DUF2752 domain-containing protein [Clostridiales bacterium]